LGHFTTDPGGKAGALINPWHWGQAIFGGWPVAGMEWFGKEPRRLLAWE
jgi:hypothetical protein